MATVDRDPEQVIATARAMRNLFVEARDRAPEAPSEVPDHLEQALLLNRYNRVMEKVEAATGPSEDVLVTVQDREASIAQSRLAEAAEAGRPLAAGGLEAKFGEGAGGGDIWGWFKSLFDHIDKGGWHPIVRPPSDAVGSFADVGRIAVISDWGTNLYGAPVSAKSISADGRWEMVLHLGDIYYSGTKSETTKRFLDVWPKAAGKVSRALNGNHEMYSGGYAYFDEVLPAFAQASSYFAVQNAHWLLVGLDTAHTDQTTDAEQVAWLERIVAARGARKVVLFSHHQPFSAIDHVKPLLRTAIGVLLGQGKITAWYWGHEHNCVIFDKHPEWGLLGRCVGHGGIPHPRLDLVKQAPVEKATAGVKWHRLPANAGSPSCLFLDGPNLLIAGEEEKFGPHGYLTLDFNGAALTERIHLPDGTTILEQAVG